MVNMNDLCNAKVYCGNRNCEHLECVRHDRYVPFDILIIRENYKTETNGTCKHLLLDWEDKNK